MSDNYFKGNVRGSLTTEPKPLARRHKMLQTATTIPSDERFGCENVGIYQELMNYIFIA